MRNINEILICSPFLISLFISRFGIEVATLVNNYLEAGKHSIDFSIESLKTEIGAGVYFYSLTAGDFRQTKKMVILK